MLDNRLVASYFPPAYYRAMQGIAFRQRVIQALEEQGINKADLSRMSKVPYHAIDKFLKRDGATTSSDNAISIANALGITVDDDAEYDELRQLFYQLDEEQRSFLIKSARGLLE